jgi:protein phosphatase
MRSALCYIRRRPFSLFRRHKLQAQPYRLDVACLSDCGRVRTLNEDAVAVDAEYGFAVVADGVGGHRAGDVASGMALDIIVERLRNKLLQWRAGARQPTPLQFAEQIIGEANRAIHAAARQQAGCRGMGTTLAVALVYDRRVALLHVGDSRIYRLRAGRLQLLTRDDSLLRDQIDLGLISPAEAGDSHNRHLVTRALGTAARVAVHLQEEAASPGDVFLLCSDGLSDLVAEDDIALIVDALKTNLAVAAAHLVQLANDNGGYDNISVALVRVRPGTAPAPAVHKSWLARLFGRLAA